MSSPWLEIDVIIGHTTAGMPGRTAGKPVTQADLNDMAGFALGMEIVKEITSG